MTSWKLQVNSHKADLRMFDLAIVEQIVKGGRCLYWDWDGCIQKLTAPILADVLDRIADDKRRQELHPGRLSRINPGIVTWDQTEPITDARTAEQAQPLPPRTPLQFRGTTTSFD